jgi:hypothetical protein
LPIHYGKPTNVWFHQSFGGIQGSFFTNFETSTPLAMPYMKNLDYRDVTNARVSSRLKQVLVLIGTILIGMIISITVNAA